MTAPIGGSMSVPVVGSTVPSLGVGGMLQAVVGLLVVIGIVFACAWLARRMGLQGMRQAGIVKILGSASLGNREKVVVVEVAGTRLVLGVGGGNVRTLHTLAPCDAVPLGDGAALDDRGSGAAPATPPSFQQALIEQVRARFAGRGKD